MCTQSKIFGKVCLKAIFGTFFSISVLSLGEGQWDSIFWWRVVSNKKRKFKVACKGKPLITHLVRHPDLSIKTVLKRVLSLFSVMTLKRKSESIFFQSSKVMACKVKDEKEVRNYSMVHPFQGKKHLRT